MVPKSLLIGDLAKRAGVAAPTIRYYESIGLLKPPVRSSSGYRHYSQGAVAELHFIRKAQALGFALDEIGEILKLSGAGLKPCAHVLSLTHRHLEAIDERMRQLKRFRAYLANELEKWEQRRTATTCDGLCEFIAEAQPEAMATARPPVASSRGKRTNRSAV